MRWSVVILVVFGIAAAVAAAVLVGALQAKSNWRLQQVNPGVPTMQSVLVAKQAIPAMTVIDPSLVSVQTMSTDKMPVDAITEPLQVYGRVLAVALVKDQALTKACFAAPGTGVDLAARLPKGMRAVAVNVADAGALPGILYPGCNVDVLVAIKRMNNPDETPRTVSTTLLENVPVLAIDQQTIVTPRVEKKPDGTETQAPVVAARTLKVTLMVDPQQAKALQLADQAGNITLSMRNPTDTEKVADSGPVMLKVLSGETEGANSDKSMSPVLVSAVPTTGPAGTAPVAQAMPSAPQRAQRWEMVVIRGNSVETKEFAMPRP